MKMKMNVVINRQLVPMKAHYFLWNAGTGPVVSYLSSYARQLGFSSVVVGLVYTILPICGMIAKPVFGAIADRFHCQKKIFLVAELLTAVAFIAIYYSPEVPTERVVHFSCSDSEAVFNTYPGNTIDECTLAEIQSKQSLESCRLDCEANATIWNTICTNWDAQEYCDPSKQTDRLTFTAQVPPSYTQIFNGTAIFRVGNVSLPNSDFVNPICPNESISTSCNIDCTDYNINDVIGVTGVEDNVAYGLYQFWLFLALMIVGWVSQAVVVSIGDAICFEMLGDKPNRYGYQRLFGSLGWGILALITGVIIDALSQGQSQKNYVSAFYMAAAFLVLDFLVSFKLEYSQKKLAANILRDVGRLLVDVRIIVYLIWCISVGMCTGLIWQFLFWLIEDLAKAQGCEAMNTVKTLQGIVAAIQCLGGELPFFFLSGWILKKIGHVQTMSLVLLVLGIRMVLYSVIENPWWILPVEFLHGLTYGLFFACMASYASIVAPPGTEATMQGMVGAVFEGLGVSLGSFCAGLAYNTYKGLTFRYFGYGSLVMFVLHAGVQYLLKLKDVKAMYAPPKDALEKIQEDDQQELTLVDS
ncbi:major facilitator superfamily domain-containing protein 6-A [Anoplophora glabripennis]|uniref:major facilitator superfamily domain-containing protein 6-A n=1 Tax=Anoplophora glabripennis TaxID=217634 RepID=UPI000874FECB|nr:major facilitator superfamily domain-containing protein 6-A [Anoplophora glabripennis]